MFTDNGFEVLYSWHILNSNTRKKDQTLNTFHLSFFVAILNFVDRTVSRHERREKRKDGQLAKCCKKIIGIELTTPRQAL